MVLEEQFRSAQIGLVYSCLKLLHLLLLVMMVLVSELEHPEDVEDLVEDYLDCLLAVVVEVVVNRLHPYLLVLLMVSTSHYRLDLAESLVQVMGNLIPLLYLICPQDSRVSEFIC